MLSWISKSWHAFLTLFFCLALFWRHASFPREEGKIRLLWMCKQWCPTTNVYIDSHAVAGGRKAVYLPCLSWHGLFGCVVYVHIHREGFAALGLERMQGMLCPVHGLRCGMQEGGRCWGGMSLVSSAPWKQTLPPHLDQQLGVKSPFCVQEVGLKQNWIFHIKYIL